MPTPTDTSKRTLYSPRTLGNDPYRIVAKMRGHTAQPSGHPSSSRLLIPRVLGLVGLLGILYVAFNYDTTLREPQLRASVSFHEYRSAHNQKVTPPLEPVGAVIANTELFYMLPPANATTVGLVVFLHACNHSGEDTFRLPEDRIVAVSALRRGLAVVSVTSSDRETGCWSEYDVIRLGQERVIDEWIKLVGLPTDVPRIGIGTSSGASILFSAHKVLGLRSMASYDLPEGFAAEDMINGHDGSIQLPATAFVRMARDKPSTASTSRQASALRAVGVPTKIFSVHPHPFTSELCDRRLPEVGDRRCHNFLARVHGSYPGLLDKGNNVLQPYQSGEWVQVFEDSKLDDDLRHFVGAPPAEKGQLSPLQFAGHSWSWAAMVEELGVSYGRNEMTCEYRNQVLDFLMKNADLEFESIGDKRRGLIGIIAQTSTDV